MNLKKTKDANKKLWLDEVNKSINEYRNGEFTVLSKPNQVVIKI